MPRIQRGATLFASNDDASYPAPDGFTWPGAGSIVAALEVATGVEAEVFGKPNPPILRAALARAGGGTPLVVGDRLVTDIEGAGALRVGLRPCPDRHLDPRGGGAARTGRSSCWTISRAPA